MTAIGLTLMFLGTLASVILGEPSKDPAVWDRRDVPSIVVMIGLFLSMVGVVVWLWRTMP